MASNFLLSDLRSLKRPVFTTNELARLSGRSLSNTVQALNHLEKQGVVIKVYRGVWAKTDDDYLSPYLAASFLFPRHRVYISFISALHLYGIIEQIPQVVTIASTAHTKVIKTKIAAYAAHKIAPAFFKGFDWYKGTNSFLIASPEKALIDSLYISSRKGKYYSYFPEMHFPGTFSFKKAKEWAKAIPDTKISRNVREKLEHVLKPALFR